MNDAARPKIITIAGPNWAGKSTLAPTLIRDTYGLMEYVNADSIALGLSAFNPESMAFESGRIMLKRLHDLARQHADFAFETTLSSRSFAGWISTLRRQDYEFHLIFLWLRSVELAIRRVDERVQIGGHNIPEDVIRRRYVKGVRNFFGLYQSLADTWGIYDNAEAGAPSQIAISNKVGDIEVPDQALWQKFREIAG
ncbi:MAG TPA: zeta toxin family protein [Pyrinomonadaceae bacterium]|nr:zeta toxin family protein [Pyrinomonadaceae bacterium]